MQPTSREMQGMTTRTAQISLQDLHNPQIPNFNQTTPPQHDDFVDQMLSNLPPWDLHPPLSQNPNNNTRDLSEDQPPASQQPGNLQYFDESSFLASRLRQHQISSGNSSLQQQLLRAAAPSSGAFAGDSGFFPLPLSLGNGDSSVPPSVDVSSYGLAGSLPRTGQVANHQHFQTPNFVTGSTGMNQVQVPGITGGGGGTAPVRQKVRARRGQATDPHSIAERLRRERITERMKALQELLPNANKTDKASMLDEIIDYVKFLQLQVKVLSMSRLGGAAAVAPLVADISPEGGGDCAQTSGGGRNSNTNGAQTANNDSLIVTEHQVAKLMEEDMGSAMQYLQGKGLCLMPISLASAISTVTCQSRNPPHNTLEGCSSPSLSVMSVQSVAMANGGGGGEASVKDATSVSKS